MPCFVPPQYRHLRWHMIQSDIGLKPIERAEWVNCEENGPTEGGHWIRWGRTGDFPSLCKARYLWPAVDQEPTDG